MAFTLRESSFYVSISPMLILTKVVEDFIQSTATDHATLSFRINQTTLADYVSGR